MLFVLIFLTISPQASYSEGCKNIFSDNKTGLDNTIESLGLPYRVIRILNKHGITSVGDLTKKITEKELLNIEGIGTGILNEIKEGLDKKGLSLKPDDSIDSWDFLPQKVIDAMKKEGIYFTDDLTEMTEKEVLNIEGIGTGILNEIKEGLHKIGLSLKPDDSIESIDAMKKEGIYFDIDALKKKGIYFDIDALKKEGVYFDIDAMKKEGIYFDIDALKKEGIYFDIDALKK